MFSPFIIFVTYILPLPLALACYFSVKLLNRRKVRLPLPPGPKGWPIIGNIFDMPKGVHDWVVYKRWCQEYDSDILYLNMAGTPVVVINSYKVAIDLLENRSSMYSGRSRMPMVNELMGWDFDFLFMDYGERWRQLRKLMHHSFQQSAAHQFQPQQLKGARELVIRLRNTKDVVADIRLMAGDTIISIAYGIDIQPKNDPYVEAAELCVHTLLEAAVPGAFLVDSIPIMKYIPQWVPGATFKRKAMEWRGMADRMVNKPFKTLQMMMEKGTAKPSLGLHGLQMMQTEGASSSIYTVDNVRSLTATIYQTGSDTTVSAISFCILSLLDHPEVVKLAQDEIDSVTDMTRLPDFGDEPLLPYLAALVKETLRFWTIAPLAFPHTLNSEDIYQGFRLPAGSLIIPNAWAMLHNEQVYNDPFMFKPERFLETDQSMNTHFNAVWGFGRRICPGKFMAYHSVWITMATILSIYNVKKAVNINGEPVEPSHDFPSSILIFPKPFQCSFTARSPAADQLLAELTPEDEPFELCVKSVVNN